MTGDAADIGPAGPADLDRVAEIFAHYVRHSVVTFETVPPTVADWQALLDSQTSLGLPFLVARTGGEVAGYAYAGPWRPKPAYRHTVEDSVYLAPGATGRGLGRTLLAELLARAGQAGARQMVAVIADAGAESEASVALHRAFGFAHVGRLTGVGLKHGRWIDTVLMQRDLAAD
jgi:L-amino acid N-acyltransferase YncA